MAGVVSEARMFPSLRISRHALTPQGAFAENQAAFLQPDAATVARLDALLAAQQAGVVAHFYMDAELQGVLAAVRWPHVHVADSLAMADKAVAMAEAGCRAILVAGVDFMSENVRAVLDAAGHAEVEVLRLARAPIGCSLAESAEAPAYAAWLQRAASTRHALHVIYINTSLRTKGRANQCVPTITCTSSNVVQTLLQAAAQVPDVEIFYGPDTYMGHNLQALLDAYAALPEAEVRRLHPAHTPATVAGLRQRLHPFEQGVCIVHHLFGAQVVARVRADYSDALYTAHLEVPGEMFQLAAEAQRHGRGVVGSTSNILEFIVRQVDAACQQPGPQTRQVVLGTESGMVTSVVRAVQQTLERAGRDDVVLELVFPVAAEAVAQAPDSGLGIVPGVAAGEGCSVAGGCATCPYMKMNHLDGLLDLLAQLGTGADLSAFRPRMVDGEAVAEGAVPILHMRAFQRSGRLPDALVAAVVRS
jgi:quinolinate synthase